MLEQMKRVFRRQQVEGVPLLPVDNNNKYSCLAVEAMSEEDKRENICEVTPEKREETQRIAKRKKAAWEKRLPREFMVAMTPSANSLCIKVQVQAMDTVRGCPVNAPSRCPQSQSIRAMSLPDTTRATTHDFTRPVHSVPDR
jgi:hypothetical protein